MLGILICDFLSFGAGDRAGRTGLNLGQCGPVQWCNDPLGFTWIVGRKF